jgi:glycosyltransferase involved in cell wall biosynthesis
VTRKTVVVAPLVSIVTPVHNGELHLAECIKSVLRQTYDNWEYVVVDNCSSDSTPEIVEGFASQDSRVRYLRHAQFVDAVASYNRAFDVALGDSAYTKVVGADDLLYPDCLQRMVDLAERNPTVGIVSAYRMDDTRVDLVGLPSERSVASGHDILRQSLLGGPYVTGSATSVLLRSGLVRKRRPFYDPSFRHADTEAAYWLLTQSDFGLVHDVLTFTRRPTVGETPVSQQLNTYSLENVRMLLRYGPQTLPDSEYRKWLRLNLGRHVWWLLKQRLKPWLTPSGQRDLQFYAYHRTAAELLLAEAPHDPDVRLAMAAVRRLLPKNG